ncbi:MAG: gamma carbonic anhydrase family protein [Pseudomonadota bacterium]
MLRSFEGRLPVLGAEAYVDPSAQVIGAVSLGPCSSVWMQAVVRGDVHHINIGARSNLQDHVLAHVTKDRFALTVGDDVTVGHHAVLHGCTIHDRVLVGIGARVLDGAVVESDAMVGAGALVTPGLRVPAGQLVLGSPARVARPLRDDEREYILELARRYVDLARSYAREMDAGDQV